MYLHQKFEQIYHDFLYNDSFFYQNSHIFTKNPFTTWQICQFQAKNRGRVSSNGFDFDHHPHFWAEYWQIFWLGYSQISIKSLNFMGVKFGSKTPYFLNYFHFHVKILLNFEKMSRSNEFDPTANSPISSSGSTVHSGPRQPNFGNRSKTGGKVRVSMGFLVIWRHFMVFHKKKCLSVKFDYLCRT